MVSRRTYQPSRHGETLCDRCEHKMRKIGWINGAMSYHCEKCDNYLRVPCPRPLNGKD